MGEWGCIELRSRYVLPVPIGRVIGRVAAKNFPVKCGLGRVGRVWRVRVGVWVYRGYFGLTLSLKFRAQSSNFLPVVNSPVNALLTLLLTLKYREISHVTDVNPFAERRGSQHFKPGRA